MKEIREKYDNIGETTNARTTLTLQIHYKLLLKSKAKRHKESWKDIWYKLKYSSSREVYVHLM